MMLDIPPPRSRRPDAMDSVSLVRSRSTSTQSPPQMVVTRPTGLSAPKPSLPKDDSGDSSNADKWFDKSNNHAFTTTTLEDHSPPYFPYITRSEHAQYRRAAKPDPRQPIFLPCHSDNSSSDEYRGVIDDLTVENKRLRRKLRTFERIQDSQLKDQKLFEVRVHGMPPAKKRELEALLKNFAIGLQDRDHDVLSSVPHQQSSSPMASSHPNADSAYVSGGLSSVQGSNTKKSAKHRESALAAGRRNVQSYLHNVSEGLLPRRPAPMTEMSQKKLVVRRLEHIFAGKVAAPSGHQQHLQQQELSHSAAKDDNSDEFADGLREATIMGDHVASKDDEIFANNRPEQRPTRPLDLDPQRAQIPADNIHYMRHLGFSPRDLSSTSPQEEGHGWIYLNVLINMAHLHTINVTASFVQQALKEYSRKFEISDDGQKVRWIGGAACVEDPRESGEDSPRKRLKEDSKGLEGLGRFAYTPFFQHRSNDDTEVSSLEADEDDTPMMPGDELSTTNVNALKRKRHRETGPIIFYNNANFCTDLCGDNADQPMPHAEVFYDCANSHPLGIKQVRVAAPCAEDRLASFKVLKVSDSEAPVINFPAQSPLTRGKAKPTKTYDLEASGIGGVIPADNFAINVQSVHAPLDHVAEPQAVCPGVPIRYTAKISRLLDEYRDSRCRRPAFHKSIVWSEHCALPPAPLPPASCFLSLSGTPDDEDELEGCSVDESYFVHEAPTAARRRIEMSYVSSVDRVLESEVGSESDGSVDLLATARQLDPEAIRARELEYDAILADRLAEEIPAGSSAATAGGGSGFNTPVVVDGRRHRA